MKNAITLFVLAASASASMAQPFQLLSQERFVQFGPVQTQPSAVGFGEYSAADSGSVFHGFFGDRRTDIAVSQTSEFVGNVWTGQGSLSVTGMAEERNLDIGFLAESSIVVNFEVTEAFMANLVASADIDTGTGISTAVVLIFEPESPGDLNIIAGVTEGFAGPAVDMDVLLQPGTYRLAAFASSLSLPGTIGDAVPADYGFDFEFTIPSPSSVALAFGAVVVAARRRRS